MDEQLGKRFIRVAAVLFLLLLIAVVAEQDFQRRMADDRGEKGILANLEVSEEDGQEAEILAQDENDLQEELPALEDMYQEAFQEKLVSDECIRELEVYKDVLKEYAQAIGEDEDAVYVAGKWKYVYDLLYYIGKSRGILYYSLEHLSNHDNRELIIGTLYNGEYIPYIVYGDWGDGIVELCSSEGHEMKIYEGGTIELRLGGVYYFVICYYRFGEEVIKEDLEMEIQEDGEITGYTREVILDRYNTIKEEITEEEYLEIIERYTAVPAELEWMPLEGF